MNILIHKENPNTIWAKSSEFLIRLLKSHQKEKILLLLSGGSVVRLYESINYYVLGIKYGNITFAQVDERFQPKPVLSMENEDMNAITIAKTGLWEACKEKKIPYYLISQEGTLEEAADNYNNQIESLFEHFSYKMGVLGIGEDAHTAGLLPGFSNVWNSDKYVVGYDLRQSGSQGPYCPGGFPFRISVTSRALQMLDQALVVAVGDKKTEAIKNALKRENMNNLDKYPAAILQNVKKVDLFTDILDLTDSKKGLK
ncbi:6-phosphogluconolactonase [Candidatus Gottesmanbacteria bacterium]|nr:6-phosphogluconolactonase [Candidatus Gottesmanbacteria bacterium]